MDYELEERIAIMIHDGGLQPAEAERLARQPQPAPAPAPPQPPQPSEQMELNMGQEDFRQAMRMLWKDY